MSIKDLQRDWEDMAELDPLWAILSVPEKQHNKWEVDEFFKIMGFEPEFKTIVYYSSKIKNNEFTLNQLPEILNPYKSPFAEKNKKEFNINFFEWRIYSRRGEDGIIDFIFSEIGTTNKLPVIT